MSEESPWISLFDSNIQITRIVWLPGYFASADVSRHDDFVEDVLFEADASYMHSSMKKIAEVIQPYLDDEDVLIDEIGTILFENNLNGFVVEASTPVPRNFQEDGYSFSYSFSWGCTQKTAVYVKKFEDAIPILKAWVKDVEEKAKEKAKAEIDQAVDRGLQGA